MVFLWTLLADKALWKQSILFLVFSIAGAAIAFAIITFFGAGIVIQIVKNPTMVERQMAQACGSKTALDRGLK